MVSYQFDCCAPYLSHLPEPIHTKFQLSSDDPTVRSIPFRPNRRSLHRHRVHQIRFSRAIVRRKHFPGIHFTDIGAALS